MLLSPQTLYSQTSTGLLPQTTNNNKSKRADTDPYIVSLSRKRSGASLTLPPLDHRAYYRAKRGGKVRTVPTSRVSSSKLSRLELTPGKRSRSANNKQIKQTAIQNTETIGSGELLGSEWLERLDASQGKRSRADSQEPDQANAMTEHSKHMNKHKTAMDNIGRRRLSKVETVRVLRARSGFLAPLPTPPTPILMAGIMPGPSHKPMPSHFQLKSEERRTEDRKKKRR